MRSFRNRSEQKELLDAEHIPFEDIRQNMAELDRINSLLGGHKITIAGFQTLLAKKDHDSTVRILELGCGGGDNLRAIRNWNKSKGFHIELTGVDINPECIAYASGLEKNQSISFIHSDYKLINTKFDIIFSSLFCHHFSDDQLSEMMKWMKDHSSTGFFINDLHRNPLAYYSIKFLTRLFSKSYLVKNDAPISVERGFIREDWERIFRNAGIVDYCCNWRWAFRWLIVSPC